MYFTDEKDYHYANDNTNGKSIIFFNVWETAMFLLSLKKKIHIELSWEEFERFS